jgi:hypothetical protein
MQYFKHFPRVPYIFGNLKEVGGTRVTSEIFQNISANIDIFEDIKNNSSFYINYHVQDGDRPDQTSTYLYGTPVYHWTFALMNDKLKERGWPLSNQQIEDKAKIDFPHVFINTRNLLTGIMLPGQTIEGLQSGAKGIILRRNLDLGNIFVDKKTTANFIAGEVARNVSTVAGETGEIIINSTGDEHLASHHFIDGNGDRVDIDPLTAPSALLTEVTHLDRYVKQNDDLKMIRTIKRENIDEIVSIFKQAIEV